MASSTWKEAMKKLYPIECQNKSCISGNDDKTVTDVGLIEINNNCQKLSLYDKDSSSKVKDSRSFPTCSSNETKTEINRLTEIFKDSFASLKKTSETNPKATEKEINYAHNFETCEPDYSFIEKCHISDGNAEEEEHVKAPEWNKAFKAIFRPKETTIKSPSSSSNTPLSSAQGTYSRSMVPPKYDYPSGGTNFYQPDEKFKDQVRLYKKPSVSEVENYYCQPSQKGKSSKSKCGKRVLSEGGTSTLSGEPMLPSEEKNERAKSETSFDQSVVQEVDPSCYKPSQKGKSSKSKSRKRALSEGGTSMFHVEAMLPLKERTEMAKAETKLDQSVFQEATISSKKEDMNAYVDFAPVPGSYKIARPTASDYKEDRDSRVKYSHIQDPYSNIGYRGSTYESEAGTDSCGNVFTMRSSYKNKGSRGNTQVRKNFRGGFNHTRGTMKHVRSKGNGYEHEKVRGSSRRVYNTHGIRKSARGRGKTNEKGEPSEEAKYLLRLMEESKTFERKKPQYTLNDFDGAGINVFKHEKSIFTHSFVASESSGESDSEREKYPVDKTPPGGWVVPSLRYTTEQMLATHPPIVTESFWDEDMD